MDLLELVYAFGFSTSLLLVLFVLYLSWVVLINRSDRLPQGPKGLPIIGNLLTLSPDHAIQQLYQWTQEFGAVFRIKIMNRNIIVVNSLEAVTEVLVTKSDDYANRPYMFRALMMFNNHPNISFGTVNTRWNAMKKASINAFKKCDGRDFSEQITHDILTDLMSIFEVGCGEPFDMLHDITDTVAYIISSLVYGCRLAPHLTRELVDINARIVSTLSPTGKGKVLEIFPWLRFLPFNTNLRRLNECRDMTWRWFNERSSIYTERGLLESEYGVAHLLMQGQISDKGERLYDEQDVHSLVIDFILSGTITTTNALYSLILILVHHPDVQKRAQSEIDAIIGSRAPTVKDRQKCHYIESLLLELLRYISHVPLSVPHETTRPTSLLQYHLPKGTEIWINEFALHHDPTIWEQPWKFDAERFLDKSGNVVSPEHKLKKQLFLFGAGRRSCLGEHMAKNRIFLFTATILQRFSFQPGPEIVSCDPRTYTTATIIRPKNYRVVLVNRH